MSYRIPTRYIINGVEFNTSFKKQLDDNGLFGQSDIVTGEIEIAKIVQGRQSSISQIYNTAYHEMIHMALECIGERDLSANEAFVINLTGALMQFIYTAEYRNVSTVDELFDE